MEKIKGIIVKTIVLLINAGLVVSGVFLIKNQSDKNNENQTADVPIPIENTNNKSITEEELTIPDDDQKEETPIVLDNNPMVTPAVVNPVSKSTTTSVPVPKVKKTTKTS